MRLCSSLHPCAHWLLSLSPLSLLSSHVSTLCSFVRSGPQPPFCLHTFFSQLSSSNPSLRSPYTSFSWPSVLAPVLFYPLPLLSWSPSHTITASPSLPLSFKHISLGAIHPANKFYGLNPFSHCVFTGLGAGIDLALFVSPITRFLSHLLLLCFLLVASLMAHHILPFSFFIYLLYALFFHLPFSFLLNLWIMHCVSLCDIVSFCSKSIVFFYYTSSSLSTLSRLQLFLSLPPVSHIVIPISKSHLIHFDYSSIGPSFNVYMGVCVLKSFRHKMGLKDHWGDENRGVEQKHEMRRFRTLTGWEKWKVKESKEESLLVYSTLQPLSLSFPFFHITSNFYFIFSCPSHILYQYQMVSFTSLFPFCTSLWFPLSSLYSCFLSFFHLSSKPLQLQEPAGDFLFVGRNGRVDLRKYSFSLLLSIIV